MSVEDQMAAATHLSSFLDEIKKVEVRDSQWTSEIQIARLFRPGHKYFNLNPFEVLQISPDASPEDAKKQYRKLSILVHPDKNRDNPKAQDAFAVVNEAYKALTDEEKRKTLMNIVSEARLRVDDDLKAKRKAAKRDTGKTEVILEEDDPACYTRVLNAMTCRLFAEIDQKKQNAMRKDQAERKRQREMEIEAEEGAKRRAEEKKAWEETRDKRVDSWRSFQSDDGKKKKKKSTFKLGTFKPPKLKVDQK